jgi:hypothetical protein
MISKSYPLKSEFDHEFGHNFGYEFDQIHGLIHAQNHTQKINNLFHFFKQTIMTVTKPQELLISMEK